MANSTLYSKIATHIVKAQFLVIGPLALDQAKMITGVTIDQTETVLIQENGKETLEKLVQQFEGLFGKASVDVCKDAVREMHISIPREDLPEILR